MFLKALAVGLSVPMAAQLARIAVAAPTPAPKRFFLFYMPHGVAPEHYNSRVSASDPTDFALDQTNVSILGPLQPYKQYVNVYQGFQYVGAAAQTHEGVVNCLSGTDDNFNSTKSRITVEHAIAKELGVKPLILGACSHLPFGLDNNGKLFWDGTSPVDPLKNPAAVADALFGGIGSQPAPVNVDVELRKSLLTFTAAEVDAMQKELSGLTSEQTKLRGYFDSIQSELAIPGGNDGKSRCTTKPSLPTVDMVRAANKGLVVDSSGGNDYFYQEKNFPLILQAQLELVAQALICNAAPVVALMAMYATCVMTANIAAKTRGRAHKKQQGPGKSRGLAVESHERTNQRARRSFSRVSASLSLASMSLRRRASSWYFLSNSTRSL